MVPLYVYVDGSDLEDVESELFSRFSQFVKDWGVATARVINDKYPRTPDLGPDDLPDWNLGLNFTVERLAREKIQVLVSFLNALSKDTGREFAIGSKGEDWCFAGQTSESDVTEFLAEQLA